VFASARRFNQQIYGQTLSDHSAKAASIVGGCSSIPTKTGPVQVFADGHQVEPAEISKSDKAAILAKTEAS
jgi:hypothetical protein